MTFIPPIVQKKIDKNIKYITEKEIEFNDSVDLKEKETILKRVDVCIHSIMFECACNHIPIAKREDFLLGDPIYKKMELEVKNLRKETNGKVS